MAKAILEFDLSEPDDASEHMRMLKSLDILVVLWEMDQYLRTRLKYEDNISDDEYKAVEAAREKLYDIMNARSVSLDDLMN